MYGVYTTEGRVSWVVFPDNPTNPPDPPKPQYEYTLRDHLGNGRVYISDKNGDGFIQVEEDDMGGSPGYSEIIQENHYYPFGLNMTGPWDAPQWQPGNAYQYNGKEWNEDLGLDLYDYGARWYDAAVGRWGQVDPLAETEHSLSMTPYNFAANDPTNNIDPDGLDWYQNNESGLYTWYDDDQEREGYKHVGGAGSVLGEFEGYLNDILINTFEIEGGLYNDGFSFGIVDNKKGALLPIDGKAGGNFLDEFVYGTGPEFSVLLGDHPYTQSMKDATVVQESHRLIEERKTEVEGQRTNIKGKFGVWGYLFSFSMAEQFIGKYQLDVFTSQDSENYLNIISDSKSRSSVLYNRDVKDVRRSHPSTKKWGTGTTYQFYIWKSPKKE
jgi:RHS repeat-associated protein